MIIILIFQQPSKLITSLTIDINSDYTNNGIELQHISDTFKILSYT